MSAEESLHTTFTTLQQQQDMNQLLSWKNLIFLVGAAGILISLLFVFIKRRKQ
ncbi:MAG: LPXTG cell wall anchor domain-containing protein [bacterium]